MGNALLNLFEALFHQLFTLELIPLAVFDWRTNYFAPGNSIPNFALPHLKFSLPLQYSEIQI